MKRLIFSILASAAVGLAVSARMPSKCEPSATDSNVFGVAFYNLENLFDTINANGTYDLEFSPEGARKWNSRKYWSKVNRLATAIAAMVTPETPDGPAIIGIAEVENEAVMRDLVDAAPIRARNYGIVHHDSPDRRGIDVGLIYDPLRFSPFNVTNHRLDVGFPTRDQMCVVGTVGSDTLAVIVNHWPSRLGGQERSSQHREAAAALCRQIADSLWSVNPNIGVIIMGDLNDDPQDRSCAEVLDARHDPAGVEFHGFYNPWWATLESGTGTLTYKGAWNLFDQIIISGNLLGENVPSAEKLRYHSHRINDFDFLKAYDGHAESYPLRTYTRGTWIDGYSDHYPTEIFLVRP